jgi:hypothetical protein
MKRLGQVRPAAGRLANGAPVPVSKMCLTAAERRFSIV